MSHYREAKRMLSDKKVGEFLRESLYYILSEGYEFQDPHYHRGVPSVEIFIKNINKEKEILFDASMRIMNIEFECPSGVTRQFNGVFRTEIRELKKMLIRESGVEPDRDANVSLEE